jgi:hypothetical protein
MATNENEVARAMAPFADEGLTTSALRVLAFTGLHEIERALRRGDYETAQEAAYAVMHTAAVLEKREQPKKNGAG